MKIAVFCNVTPCSLVKVYRRFGRSSFLNHKNVTSTTMQKDFLKHRHIFYQATNRHNSNDYNIYSHRCG
jgi:hypothetical protein